MMMGFQLRYNKKKYTVCIITLHTFICFLRSAFTPCLPLNLTKYFSVTEYEFKYNSSLGYIIVI